MRAAEQERKDLIVLVADGHQEQTVATLLTRRQPSLGIRQISIDIDSDIRPHPNHDPGVFMKTGHFLSVFAQQYEHALVLIDAEWGVLSAEEIKKSQKVGISKGESNS